MEIERKFIISKEEIDKMDLSIFRKLNITQCYLAIDDNEVRIRKMNDRGNTKYFMTIKSDGDSKRDEIEFEIKKDIYNQLEKIRINEEIKKDRYIIPIRNGNTAELYIYKGNLKGLYVIEVEFKTEKHAKDFIKPYWFGEEVTSERKYKNRNLSMIS